MSITRTPKWFGLVVLYSILLLPGMKAAGEEPKIAHATIPFQFWIGGNSLPAGDYEIRHFVSSTLVLFRSQDGHTVQEAYMMPVDDSTVSPDQAKLVFRVQKGRHDLYELWGVYGKRMLSVESGQPAPPKDSRVEVPIVYR